MANYIDTFDVKTAEQRKVNKFDLGHQHVTTASWFQVNPVLFRECVPGETVSVDMMTFARMQPLAVPTYGRANIKERAFWVPMRTIWRAWNDFITDTPHVFSSDKPATAIVDTVPLVSNHSIVNAFLHTVGTGSPWLVQSTGTTIAPDVEIVIDTQGTVRSYRFTTVGRQILKILRSLGYFPVWDVRNRDEYSALPLFAYLRVIVDYYFPSQYVNTSVYTTVMGLLNRDMPADYVISSTLLIEVMPLVCYSNYEPDYFVSAWDNPVAPVNGTFSVNFNIVDVTAMDQNGLLMSGASVSQMFNGTPIMRTPDGITSGIGSTYLHSALKSLTDYMKRHQLVGARAADRYLARFGVKLADEKMRVSTYIGAKCVPLQIGDIMSATPGTDGDQLGQFAGKGLAFEKSFNFNWKTNEYGYLMIVSSIIPAAGNVQGINRHVMHTSKLSFFTPEFDQLGCQAISTRELYNTYHDTAMLSTQDSSYMGFDKTVFGFAPRYSEYKYANDMLTGDFTMDSLNINNSNTNAWHLNRMFDTTDFVDPDTQAVSYANLKHDRSFCQGLDDHYQYNRIFQYYPQNEQDMPDPFTMIYDFDMVAYSHMAKLYDSYEFDSTGEDVKAHVTGSTVN